jgi:hypothetical protein
VGSEPEAGQDQDVEAERSAVEREVSLSPAFYFSVDETEE